MLKAKGGTWRSRRSSGGGCLYDYAAHPIDLVNWYLGMPCSVAGSRLTRIFSSETEDQVISTLMYPKGVTAQVSVNWSDESQRKMSTKITAWGTEGFIYADRQEIRVFVRGDSPPPDIERAGMSATPPNSPSQCPSTYGEKSTRLRPMISSKG